MDPKLTSIDKIARPDTSGAFPREGLYQALDGALAHRLIWVSAPAGSGKTTLVSGYVQSRGLPSLWYQVDEGDADPASFFYYLGLAADAHSPLPVFTPEYLAGIPAFVRQYFGKLSKGLKQQIIVFDECERLGNDAAFFDILIHGLSELRQDARVVMISRIAPPPAFARLRVQGKMAAIGWDELRLTPEESEGIARLHDKEARLDGKLRLMHERSQGWVAALVLMLDSARRSEDIDGWLLGDQSRQDVFDYLASELFERADKPMQDFLLKTAVLREITPAIADGLTGTGHSERILAELAGRNYFTVRRADAGGGYGYHPLFREFLLHRMESRFQPEEVAGVRRQAAALLDESGRAEDAAGLYIEAKDWAGLARLVMKEAQGLLGQGRFGTLESWLAKVPDEERRKDPWFLYWLGVCRFPFNPAGAREIFKEAFDLFTVLGETTGIFLSWSGVVDSAVLECEYRPLDYWLQVMDDLLANGAMPPPEVEDRFVAAFFSAVVMRQPFRADVGAWEEKALALLRRNADMNSRFLVGVYLILYYIWMGRFTDARISHDLLRLLAASVGGSDLMRISVRNIGALYGFFAGDFEWTTKTIEEGLALAKQSGVHILDSHLYCIMTSVALVQGDLAAASRLLKEISPHVAGARRFDAAYVHYLAGWKALLSDDVDEAFRRQMTCSELIQATGKTSFESLCAVCLAEVLHEKGLWRDAEASLSEAYRIACAVRSPYLEFHCLLAEANMAFNRADEARAFDVLRKGLMLGREQGFISSLFWRPRVMSRLCARALEAGIEPEYVKNLIWRRKIVPDMKDVHIEDWPWPVKVYTLGRFSLVKDGTAVATSGKGQKKTLDLLKAIIALGGRDVGVEQLVDALWDDSEADSASTALRVALHRLRQLLGDDRAIQVTAGRLSLDPRFVWVDVVAFERALYGARKATEQGREDEAARFTENALRFYNGHFLAQEAEKPWAVSMQERLKGSFRHSAGTLGCYWQRKGELKKAGECWHNALHVDNLAEELYQQLMTCYHDDGCRAEALQVYHRCTKALAARLGATPSEKTQAIYRRIVG